MCTSSRNFQDILAPRRAEISNFMWVSRQLKPQVAFKQPTKPTPQSHKDEVLKSPKIQELLVSLSHEQNVPKETLETQVKNILDEIGYNKKLKLIRWLALFLAKVCTKVCSGIYISEDSIVNLKLLMGDCPVIFVPSHRSYADFILMSYLCFTEDLAIPAIAAGMDFQGMWGMGTVLRDTGAFFMRRSYNDDSLYWTTFKQYVYQLVTKGELPIEFFIEGTRSRSNKSLMPKYGLILMILKAFFLSQVPDIIFVPVNISYDRIMEEKLFAFELLGIPKPKETTSGFFKSLSIIKEKYGSIYFDFAKPISAKEFFGPVNRSVHNLKPIHLEEITEDEKKQIPALAHEIVYKQQNHCVITTFNLLAITLHSNLTNGSTLLNVDDVVNEIVWLKKNIEVLGGFVAMDDVRKNVLEALEVHKNIVKLNEEKKLTLIWDKIVLDRKHTSKLKAHELSERTITFSVPFIMLQIYINPTLHYFIDVALLVIVLKHHKQLSQDELFGHYHFLRSLFSQEFVTFSTRETMEFETAITNAFKLNLIGRNNNGFFELGNNKKFEEILCNCVDCFVFSYFIVCTVLLEIACKLMDEKTILKKVQEEIEMRIDEQNAFIHPYSLNLDTIANCLNTLSSQKVLNKSKREGRFLYEINEEQVLSIKRNIEQYVVPVQVSQRKLENIQLHLKNKL